MKKSEMIEKLMELDKSLVEKDLNKLKIAGLEDMLKKRQENSAAVSEDKAGEDVQPKEEEVEPPFVTFCGMPFDPAQSSDCFQECRNATPEQYTRCVEHFKAQAQKQGATKKAGKMKTNRSGKNRWGHLVNSQAELIDRALMEAPGPITLEKIAEFAAARKPRTRHHLLHLISAWQVKLYINAEKQIFLGEKFPDLVGTEGVVEFK